MGWKAHVKAQSYQTQLEENSEVKGYLIPVCPEAQKWQQEVCTFKAILPGAATVNWGFFSKIGSVTQKTTNQSRICKFRMASGKDHEFPFSEVGVPFQSRCHDPEEEMG